MRRQQVRFTLLPEGTSDRALMPVLRWTLAQHLDESKWTIDGDFVPLERIGLSRATPLADRIHAAVELFPCEVLFVHLDEDGKGVEQRESEISAATRDATLSRNVSPVAVIPVRMTEAWLLIDEQAIRRAAGFAGGKIPLHLPKLAEVERRSDPKQLLFEALRSASGQTGRKLLNFNTNEARAAIASHMRDPSKLRSLSSFRHFELAVAEVAKRLQSRD